MGKKSSSELCDCFLCFQTCGCSCLVMLKDIFVRSDCSETLLQDFKSLNVQMYSRNICRVKV